MADSAVIAAADCVMTSSDDAPGAAFTAFVAPTRQLPASLVYQSAPSPLASPPRTSLKMKVRIKQWNAVAAWRWDMPDDDLCGICRSPYDSTCSKCKFPGDGCPLRESPTFPHDKAPSHCPFAVMGQCNHSFHMVRVPEIGRRARL